MKKRKQHYVWRHYLRAWASDEKIYCLRDGNLFQSNLMGIANKRDFYRLKELDQADIDLIKKLVIDASPTFLQKYHQNLLNMFLAPFKLMNDIRSKGLSSDQIESAFDEIVINFEEEMHSIIECTAITHLEMLQKGDTSFFENDDDRISFLNYIAVQHMRTDRIKSGVISSFKIKSDSINIDKIWNILSHILSTNIGYSLCQDGDKLKMVLIVNHTSAPFITGDQPIINTFGVGRSMGTIVENLELYYPISPAFAILITENKQLIKEKIELTDEKEVHGYNHGIILESKDQIYADNPSILEIYRNIYARISSK